MPHKHTRKGDDKSTVDLPPSITAKPLSVSKSAKSNGIFSTDDTENKSAARKSNKRKRNKDNADDTPKAFARLMAMQAGQKLRSGLDDGLKPAKKGKKGKDAKGGNAAQSTKLAGENHAVEIPTIRPGERMSDFSARVDAALPVSGLVNKTGKGGKDPLGLKVSRTKTERRMHRMYDEWREEERKIQERREEARELAEEASDEEGNVKWKIDEAAEGRKKGKKRKKAIGEIDDGDDDPWAVLIKKRNEAKVGLNDVAQAPPTFTKVPKEKFKVRGARVDVEDVPKAAGSLRRREELGEVRTNVIEQYRQMMKENRSRVGQGSRS